MHGLIRLLMHGWPAGVLEASLGYVPRFFRSTVVLEGHKLLAVGLCPANLHAVIDVGTGTWVLWFKGSRRWFA